VDTVAEHIRTFDDLDFHVFSDQAWSELSKSHAEAIIVHWPGGHSVTGIKQHIDDLKAMFVYAPDTRIKQHPVKFGSGEWTCVIGVMKGTFTEPMPAGNGRTIPPTDRSLKLPMCTVRRWNDDGVMSEEYFFWDNTTYMKQLGIQ
jgi:hypothetical protein